MGKGTFFFILFLSLAWFYVGAILIWRHAIPELYRLLIKKQDITREEIMKKEQERIDKRNARKRK